MDDKLSININIADRMYPLRIERSEEESIRKAAKIINDKVVQYKQRYQSKDIQDCLAMATLQFVLQKFDNEKQSESSPVVDELERMNDFLAEFIEKEKSI
ncbi:MAG: cell division protein ZapA [Marinilabiliales bacterium]|nr:cell division protein ZapA [Marinilabiliales bacterium]